MVMKALLRPIERNPLVSSICGTPDRVAIFKAAFCPNGLRRKGVRGNDHQCD
jgi:hypothetical protein